MGSWESETYYLKQAGDFTHSPSTQQSYHIIASPNQRVLQFFLRKGLCITGVAKDLTTSKVSEHMLYRQLVDNAGLDLPNMSIIPFNEGRYAEGVRRLILSQMSDDFRGVDDDWVDAPFAGYRRKGLGDMNAKFKVVFTAERSGEVVGIADTNGQPIKLIPLVASSGTVFEALVINLQGLLECYGHKLYVHLTPEP